MGMYFFIFILNSRSIQLFPVSILSGVHISCESNFRYSFRKLISRKYTLSSKYLVLEINDLIDKNHSSPNDAR
jgi:hypothetical protein